MLESVEIAVVACSPFIIDSIQISTNAFFLWPMIFLNFPTKSLHVNIIPSDWLCRQIKPTIQSVWSCDYLFRRWQSLSSTTSREKMYAGSPTIISNPWIKIMEVINYGSVPSIVVLLESWQTNKYNDRTS